jgi:MFS transporter, ACS family, D-galactonate transporter
MPIQFSFPGCPILSETTKALNAEVTASTADDLDTLSTGSRARFQVLALISVGTMINYLDRAVLGIAAPSLTAELHLSPAVLGIVFSAFSWAYVAAQLPGGWLLDRVGTRLTYFLAVFFWSLFTLGQGLAIGTKTLLACLFGLGISEAPCFPTNSRVVATWFPDRERAKATAAYTVGEYLGFVCLGPVLFIVSRQFGWRWMFFSIGTVGLIFSGVWWWLYREPETAVGKDTTTHQVTWAQIRQLLQKRQVWGASIGQFAGYSTLVFFLTWFPTYLQKERHLVGLRAGLSASVPFIAAACGVLLAGWASDAILKRTGSRNLARKLPIVFGLLGASTIILANYVNGSVAIIGIFSFAFFCQGMVGLGWTLISEIAPKELIGITGGIFNFAANLGGIITPIVIGAIITATGSFYYALSFIGALALLGAFSYIFLLGNVERIVLR